MCDLLRPEVIFLSNGGSLFFCLIRSTKILTSSNDVAFVHQYIAFRRPLQFFYHWWTTLTQLPIYLGCVSIHSSCQSSSPLACIMKDCLNLSTAARWSSGFPAVCPSCVLWTVAGPLTPLCVYDQASMRRSAPTLLSSVSLNPSLQSQTLYLASSAVSHLDILWQLSPSASCRSLESLNGNHFFCLKTIRIIPVRPFSNFAHKEGSALCCDYLHNQLGSWCGNIFH